MEILVAKSAGFCFGVQRAVEKAEALGANEGGGYTFGPIIHNNQVVLDLKSKGVNVLENINDLNGGDKVIIRSHGISKEEYEGLKDKGANIVDATCPYVSNIHKIVEDRYKSGYQIVIIGDKEHPEVEGVNGWCDNKGIIIGSEDDINNIHGKYSRICIVTQTTYNQEKWKMLTSKLVDAAREILIYNTVCSATQIRQKEAMELSKTVDAMIVIGGRDSSNTKKLYEICRNECPNTFFIETCEELNVKEVEKFNRVGITAGASTPEYIIKKVIETLNGVSNENALIKREMEDNSRVMERENMNQYTGEENEYFMSFKKLYTGDIVEGKVIAVNKDEVFVDIGYKSDGILPASEIPGIEVDLKEKFKAGDTITIEILAMNDGEGNVLLSRKEVEKEEFVKLIKGYMDEAKVIEVSVKDVNKGGLSCQYGALRAFMPISQTGTSMGEDLSQFVGKKVEAQIIDIKEKRGNVEIVVSRKELVRNEREAKRKEAIEKMEEGQVCSGVVKAIIKSGIFVNIGAIDVFVPISELAWKRINTPNDVIAENDKTDVSIIKVDRENMKVSGSIKRLKKEPWEEFLEKYKVDDVIEGKVVRFAEFGAFVEILDGLDGLVHISNMADRRINKPQEVVKIGETIKVKIIKIEIESKRISLSIKDVEE